MIKKIISWYKEVSVERVKNLKGTFEFGVFFNCSKKHICFGISFFKSFIIMIYWGGNK